MSNVSKEFSDALMEAGLIAQKHVSEKVGYKVPICIVGICKHENGDEVSLISNMDPAPLITVLETAIKEAKSRHPDSLIYSDN